MPDTPPSLPSAEHDALTQMVAKIAHAIEDADNGIEVEAVDGLSLTVSWPLSVDHPQPPGVPAAVLLSVIPPGPDGAVSLSEAERKALSHAIEDDLYGLSSLNETGAPSAHWFGWFLLNKGDSTLVPTIERLIAARMTPRESGAANA